MNKRISIKRVTFVTRKMISGKTYISRRRVKFVKIGNKL